MITLYTWTTPNGRKISIMLEELGIPYEVRSINISANEQFTPEFLAVSPNNKIPAIVDHDAPGGALSLFESGAILTYLADKTGQFLAPTGAERYKALEWLNWQVGGLGPMMGQLGFFEVYSKEKSELASKRYLTEVDRLLSVLDKQLSQHSYIAGEDYTIADIAAYPWVLTTTMHLKDALAESMKTKPAIARWLKQMGERPAVKRGMAVPKV